MQTVSNTAPCLCQPHMAHVSVVDEGERGLVLFFLRFRIRFLQMTRRSFVSHFWERVSLIDLKMEPKCAAGGLLVGLARDQGSA